MRYSRVLVTVLIALGMSVTGAMSAQAAGTYEVHDECGTANDHIAVTGDYWVGYGQPAFPSGSPKTWSVSDIKPDSPNPDDPERFEVAFGTFDNTPCPTPTPTPSPTAEQQTVAPSKTTAKTETPTRSTTTRSTTTVAPTTTTTQVPAKSAEPTPEATVETVPPTVVEPSPSASVEPSPTAEAMTTASDVDAGGNLIIPIGGALLIASAIGTLGYGVGKLGWFRK